MKPSWVTDKGVWCHSSQVLEKKLVEAHKNNALLGLARTHIRCVCVCVRVCVCVCVCVWVCVALFNDERGRSPTRVEVLTKNNIRLAVKKNFFHHKAPATFKRWMRWKRWNFVRMALNFAVKNLFSPYSPEFLQNRNCRKMVRTSTSCVPPIS